MAVLPPISFTKEKKKEGKLPEGLEVEIVEPPKKETRKKKDKEAMALTTEFTNGGSETTPSKKKVQFVSECKKRIYYVGPLSSYIKSSI